MSSGSTMHCWAWEPRSSSSSSTATKAQGSSSCHHWGSSGVQTKTTRSTQRTSHTCNYSSRANIYMHVYICMHLLHPDLYLHRKHLNSICIQILAELKDSSSTGTSTKNYSNTSVAHCTVEPTVRSRGLARGQFPLVTQTHILLKPVKGKRQPTFYVIWSRGINVRKVKLQSVRALSIYSQAG